MTRPSPTASIVSADAGARPMSPTNLNRPAFLLSAPFSFDTAVANNVWMTEMAESERRPELGRAMTQFLELYRYLAGEALVYLLPSHCGLALQDLVFVANLGIVPEHLPADTVVLSNFTSQPRRGETAVGEGFFAALGYDVRVAPARFEGEADLKHLAGDVYIGGYGIRSERAAYDWMGEELGMRIIPVEMVDEYLYHLDCSVFPLTDEETLVCTELYTDEEVQEIERHTGIVDVPADVAYAGACNSLRLGNIILNASHLHELSAGTDEYREEIAKNRFLEDLAAERGFEVVYVNLSEFHKGGAMLSCMVMHLNRHSYRFRLL